LASAGTTIRKSLEDWLPSWMKAAAAPKEVASQAASAGTAPSSGEHAAPPPLPPPPFVADAGQSEAPQPAAAQTPSPPVEAAPPKLAILGGAANGAVEAGAPQLMVRLQRGPEQWEVRFTVDMTPRIEPAGILLNKVSLEITMKPGQRIVQHTVTLAPIKAEQPARLMISAVLHEQGRESEGHPVGFSLRVADQQLDTYMAIRTAANPRDAGLAYLERYPDGRYRAQVTLLVGKALLAQLSGTCDLARDVSKIDLPEAYRTQLDAIRRDRTEALGILRDAEAGKVSGLYQRAEKYVQAANASPCAALVRPLTTADYWEKRGDKASLMELAALHRALAQSKDENKVLVQAAELGEVSAMLQLGENLLQQGDYTKAKEWLERAASRKDEPRYAAKAQYTLALYTGTSEQDRLAHLNAAIELQHGCAACLLERGKARWESGDFEEACSDFASALKLARVPAESAPFPPRAQVEKVAKDRAEDCRQRSGAHTEDAR
jgi:tetratricopeptide (TPR) repeat protein